MHADWQGVPPPPRPIDIDLPAFTRGTAEKPFDLLIVGCGPAGLAAAEKATKRGLAVGLIDPNPTSPWRNNYGVWVDEFEAMGHGDCFTKCWQTARVILSDSQPKGMSLDRAYGQVRRPTAAAPHAPLDAFCCKAFGCRILPDSPPDCADWPIRSSWLLWRSAVQ